MLEVHLVEYETPDFGVNGVVPGFDFLDAVFTENEIAGAIVFLASPLASAISGVVLPVDGGWTAGEPALPR